MSRFLVLLFGVASYGIFFVTFLYLIAFVGNLQATALADAVPLLNTLLPYSMDYGRPASHMMVAVLVDIGLVALFGLQHSVMARPAFKRLLTRVVPEAAERSVFVLATSLILIVMYWQWRPIVTPVIWHAESSWAVMLAWSVFAAGFGLVLLSTFLINHFHLFGLQQSLWQFLGKHLSGPRFAVPLLYKFVRHPIYLGFLLAFFATPMMTAGHLLFSLAMFAYILIGIGYEEDDLVAAHPEYRQYAEQVPMLLPMPGKQYRD